ncbi:MAG: (R)-mandelonitrile lyase [Vicinamibacteraceae bacterium]
MILITTIVTMTALLASAFTEAQTMEVTRGGARFSNPASAENVSGSVRVEALFEALEPSHASGGSVTFEPGARTAWHAHPRGQILIVTAGTGGVQSWGGPIEEIRAGDVVRIPADQKHWHGASPQASMTHIAITEHRDGARVQWMEQVSDEQYNAAPTSRKEQAQAQVPSPVQAEQPPSSPRQQQGTTAPSGPLQPRIAPGLATLTDDVLFGDVWRRSELSPRDRSLVTISVLIATGKPAQLGGHLGRALSNGLQPVEASGLLAHLAIYCGWPSAVSALEVSEKVYTERKVDTTTLRAVSARLSVPASDAARAKAIADELGTVAPKFVQLTNDVVFGDLWRRSDLTLRDRSLVTIVVLAAMGDDDQLDGYVRRGWENGLTRSQIAEALTHLGFYVGWPKAAKALTVVTTSLGK